MRRAVLAAVLLVISGAARAQPAESDSDEAGLAMQMTSAENNIKTSSALIRDGALNSYLRGVACAVAAASCPALRVYLVEMPGENVIALPSGALVIWSGTLIRLE